MTIPAKFHRELAARRNDCLHRQANAVLSKTQHVAVADLNIEGIGRTRLAKPVYDAAWRRFLDILGYKAANAGGGIEKVDPRHTSQARSGRGALVLKTLGDRRYDCPACGASLDRDVNAAKKSFPGRDSAVGRKAHGIPQGLSEKPPALAGGVVTIS